MDMTGKLIPACVGAIIGSVITVVAMKVNVLSSPIMAAAQQEPTRQEIMEAARPVMMKAAADVGACAPIAGGGFVCQVIYNLDGKNMLHKIPIMFRKGSQGWVGSLQ